MREVGAIEGPSEWGPSSRTQVWTRWPPLIGTVLLLLIAVRIAIAMTSSSLAVTEGTWVDPSSCGAPLCILNPDSYRYVRLTDYFVSRSPLEHEPITLMNDGVEYERLVLGASKNGVGYAYLSSLLAEFLDISSYASTNLLSFLSALGLAAAVGAIFQRRRLPSVWLWAAIFSPIVAYYGNQVMKETFDAFLLIVIVGTLGEFAEGRIKHRALSAVAVLTCSLLLYFDREYFLILALVVGGLLGAASLDRAAARATMYGLTVLGLFVATLLRPKYTIRPLESYYEKYAQSGAAFDSYGRLLLELPQTLLAPVGGLSEPRHLLVLVLCFPLFAAYLAWFAAALRRPSGGGSAVGVCDPHMLAFVAMVIAWTITYGGGFERGRSAVAPLLFIALARWEASRERLYAELPSRRRHSSARPERATAPRGVPRG